MPTLVRQDTPAVSQVTGKPPKVIRPKHKRYTVPAQHSFSRGCGGDVCLSGRITWLFYLTSGLPADEAFHDHVLLRDAIASGNERVAYAYIKRDREPTFEAMRGQME
jgi:hypothetical protein